MDGRRRHCLRLRPELECLCRISLHQLWIVELLAAVLAIDDDVDNDVSTLELGVNYKFNSGGQLAGAPTAPYPAGAPSPAMVYKSPLVRYAYDWTGIYFGSDGGFGWETANGTLTDAAGAPLTTYNYRVNGPVAGLFAGGNYQFNKIVLRRRRRLAMVQSDRQQPDTCSARRCRRFPGRAFHDLNDGEGLCLGPRPVGLRVRSFPGVRHRRMGLGQSFDVLCARRRGAVRQQERQVDRMDRGCWRRIRVH